MAAYEYCRATWDEVSALAAEGWRLVAVPPIMEVRVVLGQQQMSDPMYVMEREAPAQVQVRQQKVTLESLGLRTPAG